MITNIVDGANGFVGANLLRILRSEGQQTIALARAPAEDVRHRVANAVTGCGKADENAEDLHVLEYSLNEPNLGLSSDACSILFDGPCRYWHLAAAVTFFPGKRQQLAQTNIEGTRHALTTFHRHASDACRFFLISTAYSCGITTDRVRETWHAHAEPSQFRNFYEYSKREAEIVFRQFQKERNIQGALLRLGQIVGDSRTGQATSNNYGLYHFIRSVCAIARRSPNEKIRVAADEKASLHLVTIDSCVRWMLAIARNGLEDFQPPIFHLLDRDPIPVQVVINVINRYVPVRLEIAPPHVFEKCPMNLLERLVDARTNYTGKYVSRPLDFDRCNLSKVTQGESQVVTPEVLDRIVRWFSKEIMVNG